MPTVNTRFHTPVIFHVGLAAEALLKNKNDPKRIAKTTKKTFVLETSVKEAIEKIRAYIWACL